MASGWRVQDSFHSPKIQFTVALQQRNLDVLESTLYRVSDPLHTSYGQFLTGRDISTMIALDSVELDMVLQHFGCADDTVSCEFSIHRDYIYVDSTVMRAQKALGVQLESFSNPDWRAGQSIMRTRDTYSLPHSIDSLVYDIYGISDFPSLSPGHRIGSRHLQGQPGSNVVPDVIQNQYNVQPVTGQRSSMSAAEFEDEEVPPEDVTAFENHFGIPNQGFNIVGPNNGGYKGEGTLDIQYLDRKSVV